jgi:hypothetical protein
MLNIQWSEWCSLDEKYVLEVDAKAGIYEIGTDFDIKRLRGESRVVSIGRAIPSLKTRLLGRIYNPARYMNRCEKWLIRGNHKLEFRYHVTTNDEEAKWLEAMSHWEYENKHWELPPGNDRLEKTPIMEKLKSVAGEVDGRKLENLLAKYRTVEEVANHLEVPPFVIENLMVYFLVRIPG